VRYPFKPFDVRWCYLENLRPLFSEPSPQLLAQRQSANAFLLTRDTADKADEGAPFFFARHVCDYDCISGHARHFPVQLKVVANVGADGEKPSQSFLDLEATSAGSQLRPNLSPAALAYLRHAVGGHESQTGTNEALWHHVLAVGVCYAYLVENAGVLQQDWPRIPLPATRDALLASAELGRQVAALLDVEESVDAVSSGAIRHELRPLGVLAAVSGGQLDPAAGDLALTAGWGHAGKGGVTMPGRGRVVERSYSDDELAAFREGIADLDLSYEQLMACLGGTCYDVHLNDVAYWRCVPARVWTYTIGGYQVMKKWLSYRERPLLGRDLKPDEARYVTEMTRRIAALLLLEPALDENYERVKTDTYAWPGGDGRV